MSDTHDATRARLTTIFGWIAGGSLGVLINWGLYFSIGEGYDATWTTFLFFVGGAFGGMYLADKLGPRGFRPLGIAAGVLFAFFVVIVSTMMMPPPS